MTGRFDAAYYEAIRGRVRGVLIAVADVFASQQVGLVDELIDANEAGVALEMLVGMLAETHSAVSSEVVHQIERLVMDMELSSDVVEQLKGLEAR